MIERPVLIGIPKDVSKLYYITLYFNALSDFIYRTISRMISTIRPVVRDNRSHLRLLHYRCHNCWICRCLLGCSCPGRYCHSCQAGRGCQVGHGCQRGTDLANRPGLSDVGPGHASRCRLDRHNYCHPEGHPTVFLNFGVRFQILKWS